MWFEPLLWPILIARLNYYHSTDMYTIKSHKDRMKNFCKILKNVKKKFFDIKKLLKKFAFLATWYGS